MKKKGVALISEDDFKLAMEESLLKRSNKSENTPPRDLEADLRDAFNAFDLDKDGHVAKEELRVCLAMIGVPVREEVLDMMVNMSDSDQDARISLSDFESLFKHPRAHMEMVFAKSDKVPESGLNETFRAPSRQTAGVEKKYITDDLKPVDLAQMSPTERRIKTVEIVHVLLGVESIRPRDIKAMYRKFVEMDTKKIGKLNLFQFEKIFDQYQTIEKRKVKSHYVGLLFAFCDSDNSNSIDAKEFLIGLCWLSDFGNLDKLRFAFQLFDENGNGKMDRHELLQLLISVNLGSLQHRQALQQRIDNILKSIAVTSEWVTYELSFEQLVTIADKYPDLFDTMAIDPYI